MGFRSKLGNWLFKIDERIDRKVSERLRRYSNVETDELLKYRMKENQIWAKGNPDMLAEFYKTTNKPTTFDSDRLQFWKWVYGKDVPKAHYPLAESLLNSKKSLLFGQEPIVEFVSTDKDKTIETLNERLYAIMEDNNVNELYQNAAVSESYSGTIAFKFITDKEVSNHPIIQVYPQERIDLVMKYNRVIEIIFKDYYKKRDKQYTLKSIYGKGYIDYELFDPNGKEVPLSTFPELAELERKEFATDMLMAVYKKNRTDNIEFPDSGYGGSDFEGLIDLFHNADELYSTMKLYIRRSRPMTSITEDLLPATSDGSGKRIPKEYEFDVTVLQPSDNARDIGAKFNRDVPELKIQQYFDGLLDIKKAAYHKMGFSSVTVGLEGVGANQSGAALMELEKSTMILYQNATKLWAEALPRLWRLSLVYQDIMDGALVTDGKIQIKTDYKEYELRAEFDDYFTESFEDRARILMEIYEGDGMSLEHLIKKIWEKTQIEEETINKMIQDAKIEKGIPLFEDQITTPEPEEDDLND